ncbi:hypothetical protein DENSPDRAFT_885941 [Dentipellis sp. KUC8613]|nr:hypothetical protein DENSPDRAFT_885941 [Dentipellis sp. KUC8613]
MSSFVHHRPRVPVRALARPRPRRPHSTTAALVHPPPPLLAHHRLHAPVVALLLQHVPPPPLFAHLRPGSPAAALAALARPHAHCAILARALEPRGPSPAPQPLSPPSRTHCRPRSRVLEPDNLLALSPPSSCPPPPSPPPSRAVRAAFGPHTASMRRHAATTCHLPPSPSPPCTLQALSALSATLSAPPPPRAPLLALSPFPPPPSPCPPLPLIVHHRLRAPTAILAHPPPPSCTSPPFSRALWHSPPPSHTYHHPHAPGTALALP